eukprot:5584037-Amphidinium_carterae.1
MVSVPQHTRTIATHTQLKSNSSRISQNLPELFCSGFGFSFLAILKLVLGIDAEQQRFHVGPFLVSSESTQLRVKQSPCSLVFLPFALLGLLLHASS